jgi:hypothetical protein
MVSLGGVKVPALSRVFARLRTLRGVDISLSGKYAIAYFVRL